MKSSVETLSSTRVKLTVEIPFGELSDSLAVAYKKIGSQVSIPGFRKGKVPARVIDQRVGRGAVLEEAVNEALPKAYEDAIAELGVTPISQPVVDVTELNDGENLTFTAEVDIRPEFELPEYAGVAVQVDDAEVTDEKIDEQLDALRKRFGTATPVERAAADGDLVLIDVVGKRDGEVLEDYSATALSYEVGSAGMVSGADEAIRGLSEGESRTFTFTPEEGERSGKELEITVTVQGVRDRSLPDADDEFAQLASEFDTLDELRADLRAQVERMELAGQGMAAREKLLDHLLAAVEIPVPESLVEAQLGEHFEDGHGDDAHRAEVRDNAQKSIKTQFILDKIADKEEMSVGQAELSAWLVSQAPRYQMNPDQFADALVKAGQVPMAVADVRRGKALAFVLQNANVTDASGNEVNLSALDEPSQQEKMQQLIEQAQAQAATAAAAVEVAEAELTEAELLEDELAEAELVEDELAEDELIEGEVLTDAIHEAVEEAELVEDGLAEDELPEDELPEDELPEAQVLRDAIHEAAEEDPAGSSLAESIAQRANEAAAAASSAKSDEKANGLA